MEICLMEVSTIRPQGRCFRQPAEGGRGCGVQDRASSITGLDAVFLDGRAFSLWGAPHAMCLSRMQIVDSIF